LKIKLNKKLLKKQKVTDQQYKALLNLYKLLISVNKQATKAVQNNPEPASLKYFTEIIKIIEFQMQDNWNFEQNRSMHKYQFELPKCTCPTSDNQHLRGTGQFWYNKSCPYHGTKKEINE